MNDINIPGYGQITLTKDVDFLIQLKVGSVLINSDGVVNKGYRMSQYQIIQLYKDELYYIVNPSPALATISLIHNDR